MSGEEGEPLLATDEGSGLLWAAVSCLLSMLDDRHSEGKIYLCSLVIMYLCVAHCGVGIPGGVLPENDKRRCPQESHN